MERQKIHKGLAVSFAVAGLTLSSMTIAAAAEENAVEPNFVMAAEEPVVPLPGEEQPAPEEPVVPLPAQEEPPAPVAEEPIVPLPDEEQPAPEEPVVPLPAQEEPAPAPVPVVETPAPASAPTQAPAPAIAPQTAPVAPVASVAPAVAIPAAQNQAPSTVAPQSNTIEYAQASVVPAQSVQTYATPTQVNNPTTAVEAPATISSATPTTVQTPTTSAPATNQIPVFHTGNAGYTTAESHVESTVAPNPWVAGAVTVLGLGALSVASQKLPVMRRKTTN